MRSIFGKIKGPLKIYLRWPVYGAVFFAVVNAIMYFIDLRAAVVFFCGIIDISGVFDCIYDNKAQFLYQKYNRVCVRLCTDAEADDG